jgi:hypothetical protein
MERHNLPSQVYPQKFPTDLQPSPYIPDVHYSAQSPLPLDTAVSEILRRPKKFL